MNNKYTTINGTLCHRPKLKLIINPILRLLQFWTDTPFVIGSITSVIDGKPRFIRYTIIRSKLL